MKCLDCKNEMDINQDFCEICGYEFHKERKELLITLKKQIGEKSKRSTTNLR